MDKAAEIVEALLTDLITRQGLQEEWEELPCPVQQEIRDDWAAIVRRVMNDEAHAANNTPPSVSADWKSDGTGFREQDENE